MNRPQKSPSTKLLSKSPIPHRSRNQTPQKLIMKKSDTQHKHTSSTPVPCRSPSPGKVKALGHKSSQVSLSFKKPDLRKGIFSNKQLFYKNAIEKRPVPVVKNNETPITNSRQNKYQVLSKEFKIDKALFKPKKVLAKDSDGYYIPERPPLIYEDSKELFSNR